MRKLEYPTLFCNTLEIDDSGRIAGYRLRQNDGKRKAVEAFGCMGLHVFAAGDSYNDVTMIKAADAGMFFRAPETIKDEFPEYPVVDTHAGLLEGIRGFVTNGRQGIHYHTGTWHHVLLTPYAEMRFICVDREGAGNNCIDYHIPEARQWLLELP